MSTIGAGNTRAGLKTHGLAPDTAQCAIYESWFVAPSSAGRQPGGEAIDGRGEWIVWSYGERRLRRFHHASPFFATLLRLLTVKRAQVELSGVSCFVGTALSVARVSFTTVVFLTPPRRGSPRA